ncbi:MAG: hypothetical protein R3331_09290 [Sulfurospirillaceae bacterium]|nr:hypothetical protein [Sulfurospirillaceae bacterium]
MKLRSIILRDDDVYLSFQNAVLSTLIGYGKMYELLHKQLWRKGRIETVPYTFTVNGRPVQAIKKWDIKSPSTAPYDYIDTYNLGLNQLFVGQSPYATYAGTPSDGIYHDDCYIIPKNIGIASYDMPGWFIDGNGYWAKYNSFGATLVNNVMIYEKTHLGTDGVTVISDGWFYSVDFTSGLIEYPLLQVNGVNPVVQNITLSDIGNPSGVLLPKYVAPVDSSAHGGIIYTSPSIPYVKLPDSTIPLSFTNNPTGFVNVYADGIAVQYYSPYTYHEGGDGGDDIQVGGGYMICPLVYLDTGDLVQNRVDFIDNWNSQFQLYVQENGYWYSDIIDMFTMLASIVVGFIIGGPIGAMGAFMGSIGMRMGDTFLEVVGAVVSLYTSIEQSGTKAIEQEAMASGLSARTASQIAMESSLKDVFSHFVSGAGLGNLMKIGSKAYSTFNAATHGTSQSNPVQQTATKDHIKVYAIEDNNSGQSYIDKIMNIGNI